MEKIKIESIYLEKILNMNGIFHVSIYPSQLFNYFFSEDINAKLHNKNENVLN